MKTGRVISKLLGLCLAAVLVFSGFFSLGSSVDARDSTSDSGENIFFYVTNREKKSILLKVLSMEDLRTLQHGQLSQVFSGEDTGNNYWISSIDDRPSLQYSEGRGLTLPELVDYVRQVTDVEGAEQLTYLGQDKIRLMTTANFGTYKQAWTYNDLYGTARFYFEGLFDPKKGWQPDWEIDSTILESEMDMAVYNDEYRSRDPFYADKLAALSTGLPATAILSTESFSSALTASGEKDPNGKSLSGYISGNGDRVSGCLSALLDDSRLLKLLVPMSESDVMFSNRTDRYNVEGVYNLRLDMAERPLLKSAGTVAAPQADIALGEDTLTISMSCRTSGAALYYSFDGAPRIPYTGPVTVSVAGRDLPTNPVAFYMAAVKEGWDDAGIISVSYPAASGLKTISEEGDYGYTANTLTVKVGYFGGPYYEKHVFTLDELQNMDLVQADYTFIDNMPSVVIDHVEGVRLSDLMARAGIDLGAVQTFYFWTKDVAHTYYTSFPKTELIDTPRYCYYSLPDNFDYDAGIGNIYAASDGRQVDTLIALADSWNRCLSGAVFGSDYTNLNINTRFRLIYGQNDTQTRTASRSAKWIHAIIVELGGAPTLTIDSPSVLDLEVGSLFRTEASLKTADPAISKQGVIEWKSSDDSIASVDSEGNISVHAEGSAVITASALGAEASLTINSGPEGAEGNTGITEIIPQDPLDSGDQYYINQSKVISKNDAGGVQNWRVYEMSETAVELPVIQERNPLMPVIAISTLGLFLAAVICRVIKFKIDMDGGLNVFRNQSK